MRYVALDFETGNASPLSACALGASIFEDDLLVREQVSLIKPPVGVRKFHWGNVRVNHITEKMVADAPAFDEVWQGLAADAEGSVIVCHNAAFDTGVLGACLAHYHLRVPECRFVCTVKVARRVWPGRAEHVRHTGPVGKGKKRSGKSETEKQQKEAYHSVDLCRDGCGFCGGLSVYPAVFSCGKYLCGGESSLYQ